MITYALDMGIIAPALFCTGILIGRRESLGYLLSSVLLIFIDVLGVALLVMGIAQGTAGLMNIGQFIGFVVSFAILTFFALALTIPLLRSLEEASSAEVQNPNLIRREA